MTTMLLSWPVLVIKKSKGNVHHLAKNFLAFLTHNNVSFVLNDGMIVISELGRMWEKVVWPN